MKSFAFLLALAMFGCAPPIVDEPGLAVTPLSAARRPGQSFDDALAALGGKADAPGSVYDARRASANVDLSDAPSYSAAELSAAFFAARDTRFIDAADQRGLWRRASFLYPDDGCFARAAAMNELLADDGFSRPKNVFAFGWLRALTPNSPWGEVSWWFHVAPLVMSGGVAYVLDPSIEASRPLTLAEWIDAQAPREQVEVSVCSAFATSPSDLCGAQQREGAWYRAQEDEVWYLGAEWDRQVELGRDPWVVLGSSPPWAPR